MTKLQDRITRFGLDADTITAIVEITGNDAMFSAVGYLSMWGITHPICEIIGGVYDGTPELVATYRKEERGPITYQIGAVWHDHPEGGHFGFHS